MFKRKIIDYFSIGSVILLVTLVALSVLKTFDNDTWYILAEGRYIFQNGLYKIDPLSFHSNMQVIVQNWLSALIFWILFSKFGEMGIFTLIILLYVVLAFLTYKISYLISNNKWSSLFSMVLTCLLLCSGFIVTRPQVASYVLLLGVIYILELYVRKQDCRYLYLLPLISIIEINLHASLWLMMVLFAIPYIIDGLNIKFFKTQKYNVKPLLLFISLFLLCGLINPYGIKMPFFIFTSFFNKNMHLYIVELQSFSFNNIYAYHMFASLLLTLLSYALLRNKNVQLRYICLYAGTLILAFNSVKSFSHFYLVAFFPLAFLLKDIVKISEKTNNFLSIFLIILIVPGIIIGSLIVGERNKYFKLVNKAYEVFDLLDNDSSDIKLYTTLELGGYAEYRGYHPYIDPRIEYFLKSNNHIYDFWDEYCNLQQGKIDINEFLEKYEITHLILENKDYLYSNDNELKNYSLYYENEPIGYKIYVRNDIYHLDYGIDNDTIYLN